MSTSAFARSSPTLALAWPSPSVSDPHPHLPQVRVEHQEVVWPWSGYVAVHITVTAAGADLSGEVGGTLSLTVEATDAEGVFRSQVVALPINVRVTPTPHRSQRLLWDQFHSIAYPSGYFPRDNLKVQGDMLDWCGDHVHTNFREAYHELRSKGYFVDVLTTDWTCVDATLYGAVLIVDSEDEFFPAEVEKMERDVRELGLGLVVFADWFSAAGIAGAAFFDDNTRSQWSAVTGGANVPALNDLLAPFGIGFGDRVFDGAWALSKATSAQVGFLSGVNVARFPKGGFLRASAHRELKERDVSGPAHLRGAKAKDPPRLKGSGAKHLGGAVDPSSPPSPPASRALAEPPAILGAVDVCDTTTGCAGQVSAGGARVSSGGGRVVVYGDASCLDAWAKSSPLCADLLGAAVSFAVGHGRRKDVFRDADRLTADFDAEAAAALATTGGSGSGLALAAATRPPPRRPEGSELFKYSNVIGGPGSRAKSPGESCAWQDRMRRV